MDTLLPHDQEDKIVSMKKLKPVLNGMGALLLPGNSIDFEELEKVLARIRFKMLESSDSQ